MAELPLGPGSDPLILDVYQWTVAHSASLQRVVQQLAAADRKARYRLLPGLGDRFSFTIAAAEGESQITLEVPVLAWAKCGDPLEPWIASSLFLALEVISKENHRANPDPHRYDFLRSSIRASFAFQRAVRKELQAADPVRLKDLPDDLVLYESGFQTPAGRSASPRTAASRHGSPRAPLPGRAPRMPPTSPCSFAEPLKIG